MNFHKLQILKKMKKITSNKIFYIIINKKSKKKIINFKLNFKILAKYFLNKKHEKKLLIFK